MSKQEVAINAQTNLINTLNKNGYVYIDDNEILILDALPKSEAKNIWRFGLGGIGFSSNGYEGPFETAITMDGQINADFITTGTLNVNRIEGLSDALAAIEINMNQITSTVATKEELEEYEKITSTRFEQTEKDFNYLFNNATEQINNLAGDTHEQFQEIQKYIRFVDGDIVLGETGNQITLKIQNDRISFLQNNSEVAYFSNNKLYVTDGEFLNSLQLGNFAFKPRANGSLSFGKVGG